MCEFELEQTLDADKDGMTSNSEKTNLEKLRDMYKNTAKRNINPLISGTADMPAPHV